MIPADEELSVDKIWRWKGREYVLDEIAVVNGDTGTVIDILETLSNWYVVVQFNGFPRLCRLPYASAQIEPAYAITTHKAQGSGIPYVIAPVHNAFFYDPKTGQGLWCREMIYTIISRGERFVVTVGPFDAIETAVKRKTIGQRKTRLASLMRRAFAPQGRKELASVEA